MTDKQRLDSLLKEGIITKDEHAIFVARLINSKKDSDKTWEDIVNGYYDYCTEKYTMITAKGYKTCVMKYVMYATQETTYKEALNKKFKIYTFQNINKFINWMYEEQALGKMTINKVKYSLIVLGDYLNSIGVKTPDISRVTIPDEVSVKQHVPIIKEDEIVEIAESTDLRSKICILLCYEAALKRQELCRVRFEDFNYKHKQLFIYDEDGKFTRLAIISENLFKLLKEYKKELYADIDKWNKSRIKKGKELREDYGYIFQNIKTTVPSYPMLQTLLKNAAKKYYSLQDLDKEELKQKINAFTFETLRNSRRLYLLAQGNTVQQVMNIINDKNYMTTYRFQKYVPVVYPELYAKRFGEDSQ